MTQIRFEFQQKTVVKWLIEFLIRFKIFCTLKPTNTVPLNLEENSMETCMTQYYLARTRLVFRM